MPEDLKRQIRGHKNGDHRSCDWAHCQTRKDQEYEADETNFIKAVNDHLRDVGLDVRSFWGDGYDDTMAKASREIPDWLDQEPDPVLRIKARYEVSCVLAEEMAKDANPV